MTPPPLPPDENRRLAALLALGILDTPSEERFDRLTRLAMVVLDTPIAVISLVDRHRQWYKSCQGLCNVSETTRDISFCGHAILQNETFIVPDTWLDERFADNPLVTGEPFARFYAGQPISTADGSRVGVFCVMDRRPRQLDAAALAGLRDLAALAQNELLLVHLAGLQDLLILTSAAVSLERGKFDAKLLEKLAHREDPVGRLAREFERMAQAVQAREDALLRQVDRLVIQINDRNRADQVAAITDTDYFHQLQLRAQALRQKMDTGKG